MASFCKQCAEELDFDADYTDMFKDRNDTPAADGSMGFYVLCETCGDAFIIDDEGTCGNKEHMVDGKHKDTATFMKEAQNG